MRLTAPRVLAAISITVLAVLAAPQAASATVISVSTSPELRSALSTASNGDVIEIQGGTYAAPSGGFLIQNRPVNLTVRAADQATVILTGSNSTPILKYTHGALDTDHTVVFESLNFRNGFSSDPQVGGGVTLIQSVATFVDCHFSSNTSTGALTGGGAVFMRDGAVGHFFDCTFSDNQAVKEGAAIRLRSQCHATVHDCTFDNNRTDLSGHHENASGGAINVFDSSLTITNSRFTGNAAGCVGGAVYVKGIYDEDLQTFASELLISNSLFEENRTEPAAGVQCTQPTVAGAIHLENDVLARVYASRFLLNGAEMGGAIGNFRSELLIEDSVFRGNQAFGTTNASGTGGAIHSNSTDVADGSTDDGAINRPSAVIQIHRTFFQGRYGTTGAAANKGACVYARGDSNRSYGVSVPQDGTPAQNRTDLDITDSVFVNCDSGFSGDGDGGALVINHTDLTLDNCLVLGNDAAGTTGNGAAMRATVASSAHIFDSWFQDNTAGIRAAVFMVSGSDIEVDQCTFIDNTLSSGAKGSVLWSTPADATNNFPALAVRGSVSDSTFVRNIGWDIAETDNASGPVNAVTYHGNQFYTSPVDGAVYNSTLAPLGRTVGELNSYVAVRNGSVGNTDKAPNNDNLVLTMSPKMTAILAAPPSRYHTAAPGETDVPTRSFLAWGWNGGNAQLDSSPLNGSAGCGVTGAASGLHSIRILGGPPAQSTTINDAAVPAVDLVAAPEHITPGEHADLGWNIWRGEWVDVSLDRGIDITAPSDVGSESVAPAATMVYRVHAVTKEGGEIDSATVFVDVQLPDDIFSDGFESGDSGRWNTTVSGG